MSTPTAINLGHGVELHVDHSSDGWRAVELTALGNLAGSSKLLHLSPPREIAERRFMTSEELAQATLSWLYSRRATSSATTVSAKTLR